MKRILYIALLVWLGNICNATGQAASKDELEALFDTPDKIQWTRNYKGLINNIESVEISLASDGRNCRGYVLFPKSQTTIELRGILSGSRIELRELNDEGLITAYLKGSLTPGKIEADWENYNHTIGCKYVLYSESEAAKLSPASQKKWIKWYSGEVAHEKLRIILFQKEPEKLTGFCFNDTGTRMYNVNGMLNPDKSIFLNFLLDETEVARFDGKVKSGAIIKGTTTGIGVTSEPLQLELENELNLEETSYQNFRTAIEILTPKLRKGNFEKYILEKIEPYIQEVNSEIVENLSESHVPQPSERLSQRAYIYPVIRFVSKEIISGHILYTNTWDKHDKTIAFNYDVRKKKEISQDDIWNPKLNMQDTLAHYFESVGKPGFSYKYFNLTPQGIRFYDDLNPLYGRNDVTIPYAVVRRWVKGKSPVRHLINPE